MLLRRSVLFILPLMFSVGTNVVLADSFTPNQFVAQTPGVLPKKEGRREQLMQQLNLTDAQKQKVENIRQKYQGQIRPLRDKMQKAREDLRRMMAGTDSSSAIRNKHQEIVDLRGQLDNLRFQIMLETREVLTPQQRTQMAQMMQQRMTRMRERMHGQNGGNPNPNRPEPPDEFAP